MPKSYRCIGLRKAGAKSWGCPQTVLIFNYGNPKEGIRGPEWNRQVASSGRGYRWPIESIAHFALRAGFYCIARWSRLCG